MKQLLTVTRYRTLLECARRHELRYELGIVPVVQAPELLFGSAGHVGLEARFNGIRSGFDEDRIVEEMWNAMQANPLPDPFERERVWQMVRGYHWRYIADMTEWEILAVEMEFRGALRNPATGRKSTLWNTGGKIDLIIRERRTGRVLNVEHKTSSADISPGSAYWQKRTLDPQISVYHDATLGMGLDVAGCIFDVLGKVDLRPKLATPVESRKYTKEGKLYANQRDADESVEEYGQRVAAALADDPLRYYQRGEIVRLEADMAKHRMNMWRTMKSVIRKDAPMNSESCVRGKYACPYLPACAGQASLDDESRYRRMEDVHPELKETADVFVG